MNLLQIRQKLRIESGRFDLVNSDGSDSGADFFINEGSRYLDRLETIGKSVGYNYSNLPIGECNLKRKHFNGLELNTHRHSYNLTLDHHYIMLQLM